MSQLLFELHAVIEHPPYSIDPEQHHPLLKETTFSTTALNATQAKNQVFEDCLNDGIRLVHLEIANKRETR